MRRGTVASWTVLLVCGLAAALAGCSDEKKAAADKPSSVDLAAGKAVAERSCQPCHLIDGRGTAPGIPNLAGEPQQYLVTSLIEYRSGRRLHGALRNIAANLSDADTQNVTAYFASLKRPAAKDAVVFSPFDHGKTVAPACAACHGDTGISSTAGTPNLAGQQPQYFVTALQEYLNGTRETSPMHVQIRKLDKVDMDSVALYFGSQTPSTRPAPRTGDPAKAQKLIVLCAGCHGLHGVSGDSGTPSLASQDPIYLVNAIKAYRNKRRNEPMQRAVAALSDDDVENIAAYYTTQPGEPAENGADFIKETTEKCNRCHANRGAGIFPLLNGQDKDYLIMALRAYRDGRRQSTVMHNMSIPYGDAVIESLASFYASQPPEPAK